MRASKKSISEQLNAFSSPMAALPEAMSEIQHGVPCTHSHNYPLLVPLRGPLPTRHTCERRMLVGRGEICAPVVLPGASVLFALRVGLHRSLHSDCASPEESPSSCCFALL